MYQEERLRKILEWLRKEQVLSNQDLMERLDISRDTARRDIIRLTETGRAIRTHGGIARTDFEVRVENYQSRMMQNEEGKQRIGEKAAELLEGQDICFFDTSTHMPYVCGMLNQPMKVYTHSLENLILLASESQIEVHSLGGTLNKENRFFYGFEVWETLMNLNFDTALLGVAAMGEDGIYYENEEDAQIKRLAARRVKKVIVMADYPKFQRVSKFRAIGFDKVDLLILDREPTSKWKQNFEKEAVQWIVV